MTGVPSAVGRRPERIATLVVGGGLLGCAVSYLLAAAGTEVLLVDKGQLNAQASGQNAGSLHFQLEYRMLENGALAARKAAEAMPLHLHALRAWSRLEAELGADLGVRQQGGLMVAESAEQVRRLGRKIALEQAAGLQTELLDRSAVRARAPYLGAAVVAAAFCPAEGKADPRRCALAYARAALRLGAQVHARTGVQALCRNGRRWRVVFDDGGVCHAEQVVLAAGAWTGRLAQMAGSVLPVFPVGLTMAVTAPAAPLVTHLVQHAGRRLSLKQTPEGNVLIGGGWPAALRQTGAWVDLERRPQLLLPSLSGNMAAAVAVVPAVAQLPVLRVWTGTTALVADQLPLLGAVPKAAGLFVATGGSAFTLAPTYARILADKLLGKPDAFDLRAYDPERFASLTLA
ncbi:FAD-binding oxidoreductase [Verminephrobacter eiseniae]|uniref:NAD(P)/FAD-dependent oxidoreductase n=1 Tax=Verminephrobacter eiseniae TaxID=364317 RepID=UPI002237A065|nr:FAD-binding oxidoreductase [Verminephrobacter eiseniae]MCW5232079.1 FAD-binding oxidoreductase [Verminephrobacter eiseniae]